MAPYSSTLAWKIPWNEVPSSLQSMGSSIRLIDFQLSDFTFTFHFHALEKDMATHSVFLPGESQGRGSPVGCRLWGCTESDTTETTQQQQLMERYQTFSCEPNISDDPLCAEHFMHCYATPLPCSSNGKESACDAGDQGSIHGLGSSYGEENGNPLQYTCLENSMDREAWRATVCGVAKSRTRLSD